jgi:hypothetical protein
MYTCEHCGLTVAEDPTIRYCIDPFEQEIKGITRWVWLCDDGYHLYWQEI